MLCAVADVLDEDVFELSAAPVEAARTVEVHVEEMPADQVASAAVEARLKQLPDPTTQPAGEALRSAVAAARGIALLPVNQHPYGLGNDIGRNANDD